MEHRDGRVFAGPARTLVGRAMRVLRRRLRGERLVRQYDPRVVSLQGQVPPCARGTHQSRLFATL